MSLEIINAFLEDCPACCFIGKRDEQSGELYGLESHNLAMAALADNGWKRLEDDWCFERHNCPRFTTPDAEGRNILDYGISVEA